MPQEIPIELLATLPLRSIGLSTQETPKEGSFSTRQWVISTDVQTITILASVTLLQRAVWGLTLTFHCPHIVKFLLWEAATMIRTLLLQDGDSLVSLLVCEGGMLESSWVASNSVHSRPGEDGWECTLVLSSLHKIFRCYLVLNIL